MQKYTFINFGQVEFMGNLLSENYELSMHVDQSDLNFFVQLIQSHGQRAEFLEIFEVLLTNAEEKQQTQALQKLILTTIFSENNTQFLNVLFFYFILKQCCGGSPLYLIYLKNF